MNTTPEQDRKFISEVIPHNLLEDVIQYIKDNFDMEDFYGLDTLHEWAKENGYTIND